MPKWYQANRPITISDSPWLHPDATAYLEGILSDDMHVIEFGGGGSTVWLSARANYVYTCENNKEWRAAIRDKTNSEKVIISDDENIPPRVCTLAKFDMLFIDGEPVERRAEWLRHAEYIVNKGGWIVLDNANRPEYVKERAELLKFADLVETVNGNEGSTRFLITEFYKVRE